MLHTTIYSNIEDYIRNQSANIKIEQSITSDKIRNSLTEIGIRVKDRKDGVDWEIE